MKCPRCYVWLATPRVDETIPREEGGGERSALGGTVIHDYARCDERRRLRAISDAMKLRTLAAILEMDREPLQESEREALDTQLSRRLE